MAQTAPLEIRQHLTPFNSQWTTNAPLVDGTTPTAGQFGGLVSFGAVLGTNVFNTNGASFPSVKDSDGAVRASLRFAVIGAPYFGQRTTFLFGQIIPAPDTDETGTLPAEGVSSNYWRAEPHSTDGHVTARYYWSNHKKAVFANQAGPIEITWRKAKPDGAGEAPDANYVAEGGNYYRLLKASYVVSGVSVKPARTLYWTEQTFADLGKPVNVPSGRVRRVNIVYNSNFPQYASEQYFAVGESTQSNLGTNGFRTLWYDNKQIHAYNLQGRVLVELLGDGPDDAREHLGIEVVDVLQQPTPEDVTVELGDRLRAFSDGQSDSHLTPDPLLSARDYLYQDALPEPDGFYATRETRNLNDVLVHWLEEGELGLLWPKHFVRYQQIWPANPARYSHYLRPTAETDAQAELTAVKLPAANGPVIAYQDPLDTDRAKLTPDSRFYTLLDEKFPAHRTLLRFNSGANVAFERVFSWLDQTLKSNQDRPSAADPSDDPGPFSDSVATSLSAWNSGFKKLVWPVGSEAPRVIDATIDVGQRIPPPSSEIGAGVGESYWAGHIRTELGTSFHPQAYVDPFASSFEAANRGAIIPVNAIPGQDHLEVWWFRDNNPNLAKGFKAVYWPAVIGRYTLTWPADPSEIVLASNAGSGGLPSLQAKGSIYVQNDSTQLGYNPNEEHALMLGGQVFALRDDLNVVTGASFSSQPYVLLSYTESDGRPAVRPFKVLREKPSAGLVFDYLVEAGQKLQAPMPLPLLPKPVQGTGALAVNFNTEPGASTDLPVHWNAGTDSEGSFGHYDRFTFQDRKNDFWVYRALHAGLPVLRVGTYRASDDTFQSPVAATAVVGQEFSYTLHASRLPGSLRVEPEPGSSLPSWLTPEGTALRGVPGPGDVGTLTLALRVTAVDEDSTKTVSLTLDVVAAGTVVGQAPLEITSHSDYADADVTYVGRPPYLAASPTTANSFTMRFYYRTQDGFAWPGVNDPPAVDSIVPYLRPLGSTGDPAKKTTPSLDIVYRPYWPYEEKKLPRLNLSDTLTLPKNGLPAVRGQTSLQILYQQSIAADINDAQVSAVLHDPTREKSVDLQSQGLEKLPSAIRTSYYQGKWFFPSLPPYLAQRFFYDPNRGAKGHLVFKGEFKDEPVGEKYLLLNVLSASEQTALKALCPPGEGKTKWDNSVDGLTTVVETFREVVHETEDSPPVEVATGVFEPDHDLDRSFGPSQLAEITDPDTAVDSYALSASGPGTGYLTLLVGNGRAFTPESEPVSMYILKVKPQLHRGEVKVIAAANPLSETVTFQHTPDLAARFEDFEYDWRIGPPVDGLPPRISDAMTGWTALASGTDRPRHTLGGSGIQTLGDNYVVVRYRAKDGRHPLHNQWSDWTEPQLAEGWIKRVLAGINPFNQRVSDLFNNRVNTDVSLLTQAGKRWEGDIPLNLANINEFGLIEIYETVLRRGKSLSIDAGINFGPANDALLLAAGYLNDLYMIVGNEASADAANPTIGIGTKDRTYGDIATALFAFKGQVPSVLEEELALLRGRDDFLQPGVNTPPVYNRLFWNYTRGIDSGEVIYALNYNIQENPNSAVDGVVNADDARRMYPQGHGDAYGHYLTALKGYYSLLLDTDFDWVPRTEAVSILGKPVQVDYQDERKFAAAAAALARAGRQIVDLTWRRDYQSGEGNGWERLSETRTNDRRTPATTRHWGLDHWASRAAQGSYLNWVVGNAILPDIDPDPEHEGIQKIDRGTVPELKELAVTLSGLQTSLDNAEGNLSPLGLPDGSIAFDINPNKVVGGDTTTHFEQVYERAKGTLSNALAAFDDAKDVTRLMRSEQDSLAELQAQVTSQELAYQNSLIELYGTPYTDDIGPGKTYAQGYAGPDLIHYSYVDLPEIVWPGLWNYLELPNDAPTEFIIDLQDVPDDWIGTLYENFDFLTKADQDDYVGLAETPTRNKAFSFNLGPHGFADKPPAWTGKRASPGKIQQAISELIVSHRRLKLALYANSGGKYDFDKHLRLFEEQSKTGDNSLAEQNDILLLENEIADLESRNEVVSKDLQTAIAVAELVKGQAVTEIPDQLIFGTATGGDTLFKVRAAVMAIANIVELGLMSADAGAFRAFRDDVNVKREAILEKAQNIADFELRQAFKDATYDLFKEFEELQAALDGINFALRDFDDASRKIRALTAEGDRIQAERETFRRRSAALVQGFRTRDAAFRIFRNEKLERYKSLFDLAARYAIIAANAYDYETGLLHTSQGKDFISRIVRSRALGVMRYGEPQFAGSNTGDPGLSSAMAEMKADWDVLKGRLGFNNPDAYGTTFSLRSEQLRILPGTDGLQNWRDALQSGLKENLLADADVRRYCLQIDRRNGLPVPGIVIEFSTTITEGLNFFGRPLAAFDHYFSPSSFATKLYAVGVALEGYVGMDSPSANSGVVGAVGGISPPDPARSFLDETALAATPYVYLIPVGVDSMRSPPLGDESEVRTWSVNDVVLPLPFNIGASEFSTKKLFQSSESLTEPLFDVRKHQAFRPVSTAGVFSQNIYGGNGNLAPSQFTNRRLIGRSAWNSKWKLVIPGHNLLNDPNEGLKRFINTVTDIKLHFVTYSYSGN